MASAHPVAAPEAGAAPHKWVVAGTVLTGTIMAVLDSSIVNVALPDMSGTLGATIEQITWVVTGYILANVIIMPIIALLSSRFGRKNFYMTSVLLFTLASMACGLARSLEVMVFFRVIQGVGGGVMITVAQAILRETFPREEQGLAMGIYGMGVVLAPAIGPTLGGWLVDQYSWPWIFYINVPIGVLNIVLVSRFIEDPSYLVRSKGSIDWLGLGLMTAGLGSLQLLLEKGQDENWFSSAFIIRLTVVAAMALAFFVWRELATDRPAVNLRLFRILGFSSATVIGGILGMGLYGSLFLLPMFLQNLLRFTAMKSGIVLMPRSLAMAVLMPIGGRFYNKLGPRVLVAIGLVVSAYSFWDLSHLTMQVGFWDLFWPQLWQGVGFSLIFVALSTAALAPIDKSEMTAAAGLYNVVRQVCGSIGIAAAATELTSGTARYHDALGDHLTMFDVATRQWLQRATAGMMAAGADLATAKERALALLNGIVTQQAAVLAFNRVFVLVAILFAVSLPLVLLLRRGHETLEGEVMVE